jgi:hypothetical protein
MVREAANKKFCDVLIDTLTNCIGLVLGNNDPFEDCYNKL